MLQGGWSRNRNRNSQVNWRGHNHGNGRRRNSRPSTVLLKLSPCSFYYPRFPKPDQKGFNQCMPFFFLAQYYHRVMDGWITGWMGGWERDRQSVVLLRQIGIHANTQPPTYTLSLEAPRQLSVCWHTHSHTLIHTQTRCACSYYYSLFSLSLALSLPTSPPISYLGRESKGPFPKSESINSFLRARERKIPMP